MNMTAEKVFWPQQENRERAKGWWGLLELGQDGGEDPVLWQQQRDWGISPASNSALGLPKAGIEKL